MYLSRLKILQLRNLRRAELRPVRGLNVISGNNGSGKTSVLEAIHLLALARSFRSAKHRSLITDGCDELTVFGELVNEQGDAHRLGVRKRVAGSSEIRVDGREEGVARLAALLPLQLITPGTHALVEQGPGTRRAFIDWGLFHVEQTFYPEWARYRKALMQRNAGLKTGGRGFDSWDRLLVEHGEAIDRLRREYLDRLAPEVRDTFERLVGESDVRLEYQRGWAQDRSLAEALGVALVRDRERGFTSVGPHRAEVRILVGGRLASDVLSRGQQKLMVAALRLAQLAEMKVTTGRTATVLVDDLPSELDAARRVAFMETLGRTGSQLFVTAIEPDQVLVPDEIPARVFHVEQGELREVV